MVTTPNVKNRTLSSPESGPLVQPANRPRLSSRLIEYPVAVIPSHFASCWEPCILVLAY